MSGSKGHSRNGPVALITFPFVRERVLAALLRTDSAKGGAMICGLPHRTFCRFVNKLGFTRMYVTKEERAAVMRSREIRKESAA